MSETSSHQAEPLEQPPRTGPGSVIMVRKYNVKRSCIRCHERKVRCDKEDPCIACVRSDVQCRYPGPERAKRVKSRSQRGLASVTVGAAAPNNAETYSKGPAPIAASTAPRPSGSSLVVGQFSATRPAPSESEQSGGFLLKEGSSTRYVNEFTFSRVLEKVRGASHSSLTCTWTPTRRY